MHCNTLSFFLFIVLFSDALQAQVNRYAVASGDWNQTSTWSASSGGAAGASVPVAGDFVFIGESTTSIAVSVPTGYTAACATIAIGATTNASSSLTLFDATSVLNVSGTLTINRPSITNINAFLVNAGTASIGGTVTLAGATAVADRINKIIITSGSLTLSSDLIFITGSAASNVLDMSGGAGSLFLGGNFTGTAGTIISGTTSKIIYNKAGAQTVNPSLGAYNNLTLTGSGAKTISSITVNDTLSMQGSSTTAGTVPTFGASSTLEYAGSVLQTTGTEFKTPWAGTGGVVINNANGVKLGATKTITKGLIISNGQLDLNAVSITVGDIQGSGTITSLPAGTVTLTTGSDNLNTTFTGALLNGGGTFSLTKSGTGTLTLTGNNSYAGITTISAGTIKLGAAGDGTNSPLGTVAGATSITAGASLELNGITLSIDEPLTLRGTGIAAAGAVSNSINTNINYTGPLTLGAAASISIGAGDINFSNTSSITGATFGLTLTGTGNGSLAGALATTTGTLTKSGTGTWTLSGASTFTGATSITAGTLKLGASSSELGTIAGITTVNSGAVLDLNGYTLSTAEPLTINGSGISGGGALTNSSATNVDYTGLLKLGSASTIVVNNGAINLSATGTISGSGFALTLDGSGNGTLAGIIGTAAGTLIKIGSGTWTLSGASTYTGTTTISAGTIKIGIAGGGIPNTSAVTNSAILDLNGNDETVGSIAGAGTITSSAAGSMTLTAGNTTNTTYSGLIENGIATALSINKTGTGTLILSGTNTYSGLTTVTAGILKLGAAGDATNSPIGTTAGGTSVISGAALDLNGFTLGINEDLTLRGTGIVNGGALTNSSATGCTFGGLITLGAASSIVASAGDINLPNTGSITGATFALTLAGTGNGSLAGALATTTGTLTKSGTGTWTISGASTFTGATAITAGTLKLGASGSELGTIAGITTVSSGAVLDLNGYTLSTAEPLTINGSGIAGSGALTNTSATDVDYTGLLKLGTASSIIVNNGAINLSAVGTITGSGFALTLDGSGNGFIAGIIGTVAGTLTKTGSGTWTLSGSSTYTGTTTINTGTLKIGLAGGAIPNTSAVTNNATLDLNGNDETVGSIAGTGTITSSSAGTITLTAGNTTNTIYSGLIENGSATTLSLSKTGTGILTLSGTNTYTGLTSITAGTLKLGAAGDATNSPIGTAGAGTSVTAGAVLDLNGYSLGINEDLTLRGTGIAGGGALTNSSITGVTYGGLITLGAASSIVVSAGDINLTNTGSITGATFALTLSGTGNGTLAGALSTGTGTLTKTGTGTWTISGSSTYTGATSVTVGTLKLGASSSELGTTAGITTVSNGAVLDLNGYTLSTAEPLTISGSGIAAGGAIVNSSPTAATYSGLLKLATPSSIVVNNGDMYFTNGGIITGATFDLTLDGSGNAILSSIVGTTSGKIVKTGSGIWTLSGTNTFTGGTILTAGTLNINNAQALGTAAGTFTIAGGTLDNTTGGPLNTVNYPQAWNGDFIFGGTQDLNLGTGAITVNANTDITANGSTLTVGGILSGNGFDVTKGGAGNLNFGSNTVSINDFTIYSGSLKATSGTMNISGDFINSGTFIHNNGVVSLNGTSAQAIGGSSVTTFNNLLQNNSNGVTLNTSANVNNTFTLTSGKFSIVPGSMLNITSGNAVSGSGFDVNKHIVTEVNTSTGDQGILRVGGFTGTYTFPTGNGTYYMPTILNASGTNDFSVTVFQGSTQNGQPNGAPFSVAAKFNMVDAIWVVNRNSGSSSTTMQVTWPDALEGTGFSNDADNEIGISYYNGGSWDSAYGSGNQISNIAARNSIISFGSFGVGKVGQPLSLNFRSVKLSTRDKDVEIDWSVLNETDVDRYEIERSSDNLHYKTVGVVQALDTSMNEVNYSWIDFDVNNGSFYYRIKAIDRNGNITYSAIVHTDLRRSDDLVSVYPNPIINGRLALHAGNLEKGNYTAAIYNSAGQQVILRSFSSTGGSINESIELPGNLQKGIYMLHLSKENNSIAVRPFIVQ